MGLNDLTLEKLIGEINGYKEKMRTIYEDYGRASQELQDRINVLGYNLNEHLKETKDQISSTPQRLLTLETKYVSGEVNETEYRQQREEFKALLQRNLHSIEEIRSMIEVLSHIEARPLTPTDIKQPAANPLNPARPDDWGKPATFSTPPPTLIHVATPPPQMIPKFAPEPAIVTPPVETAAPKTTPSPTPASNGNGWNAPNPQPANASEIAPLSVGTAPAVLAIPQARVAESQQAPMGPELASATPTLVQGTATADDAAVAFPSVDIVEGTGPDDALMVKVVDDISAVEASAAVVSSDTSQVQSPIAGTEPMTSVPNVAPDMAQVSQTPPSQFYQVVCPKCGADVPKPAKVWELKGGKSKKNVLIGLFQCQDCRVKFREALTREIL